MCKKSAAGQIDREPAALPKLCFKHCRSQCMQHATHVQCLYAAYSCTTKCLSTAFPVRCLSVEKDHHIIIVQSHACSTPRRCQIGKVKTQGFLLKQSRQLCHCYCNCCSTSLRCSSSAIAASNNASPFVRPSASLRCLTWSACSVTFCSANPAHM